MIPVYEFSNFENINIYNSKNKNLVNVQTYKYLNNIFIKMNN